jgi:threonine dehydrogenase-like Zn-dependent dehydrogenase
MRGPMMKAVVLENSKLSVKDIPNPEPGQKEALIRVFKAGICNTDLELVKGYMDFQGVLGHEFVGEVVQASDPSWMGKRVVGEINLYCGKCELCLSGNTGHCRNRDVLGIFRKDGAFAEFLTLPLKNLFVVDKEISDVEAVFVEPLAAALEILEQVEIQANEPVLVLGDGKLGLLIAQVIKSRTDEVYCIGKHERKLALLKKKNISTVKIGEPLDKKFLTVVEATGNELGLKMALDYVQPRGRIILKSTFHGEPKIDLSKIVVDEIILLGSRCGPFYKALDYLKKKKINVEGMIDEDFPLTEVKKAFEFAQRPGVMKVLLTPE